MHISRIRIRNYRNFRNAEFRFEKGVNTLIGENGSGKTNAFQAIRLLLDDSLSRGAVKLRESDFNRAIGSWKGHWIIISIDFDELDATEGCQVIRHKAGHMDDDRRGTYTYFFRPNKSVRASLYEITKNGGSADDLRHLLDEITIDQYEPMLTGRSQSDFLDEGVYELLAGDHEAIAFPNPEEEDAAILGDRMVQPLHYEVSCTFVKALRDVIAELRNYRDSPLLNLLRGTERKINIKDATRILEQIGTLNTEISSLDEIRVIAQGIQDSLHKTVGYTYSPHIDIQSAIPEELDRLLQRLSLTVSDPGDDGYRGEIDELSLGGANLIYLSLKLLEYEMKTATDRVAHFLLIEEPESHIHTHIQKTLFEKYAYDNTQVIVSTHSTHISAASKIRSVNILAKDVKEAQVFHPSNGLDESQCERVERYLDAVRSTLLFAKGVILVEGDAELILIPSLVRKVFGISLDELGVSLICMSSTVFANLSMLFHNRRIRRRCAILTDLDESIVNLPDDAKEDDKFQAACRLSQVAGKQRRKLLDEACNKNPWCQPFYADHTFEVDFLMAGNDDEIVATLPQIYQKAEFQEASEEKIRDANIEVWGREVLRLANKLGKGWFAVLVAEQLGTNTITPSYILEAVAFASRRTSDRQTLRQMVTYRCENEHEASKEQTKILGLAESGSIEDLCKAFTKEYPDDVLTTFISLI